jgi:hypothetical protein
MTEAPASVDPPTSDNPHADTKAVMLATLGFISTVAALTAVRLLLLLAVIGGWSLAWIAAGTQSNATLFVLIAYAVLIVLPLVWLDSGRRPG